MSCTKLAVSAGAPESDGAIYGCKRKAFFGFDTPSSLRACVPAQSVHKHSTQRWSCFVVKSGTVRESRDVEDMMLGLTPRN